jgi:hypothetical protein
MAGPFAALNGIPIVNGTVTFPYSGIWHADVTLDTAVGVAGPQVLTLADLSLVCSVVRGVNFAAVRQVRLVGGQGGWRTNVPPLQYYTPGGVATSIICSDLAALVGEIPPVIGPTAPQITTGPGFVRKYGLASNVLQQLFGDQWWMDYTGTVQVLPRPVIPVPPTFETLAVSGAWGIFEIYNAILTPFLPGAAIVSPTVTGTINRVMHYITPEKVRTEIMIP